MFTYSLDRFCLMFFAICFCGGKSQSKYGETVHWVKREVVVNVFKNIKYFASRLD